jgi:gliding motility-associated-like protein
MKNYFFSLIGLVLGFSANSNEVSDKAAPAPCPTIVVYGTPASCYGYTNGTATVSVSGGSGNYTHTWSLGPAFTYSGTSSSINNLAVGTYTVTVKDNVSGCAVVGAYVVTSPDPITVSGVVTNVNCFGQATGSVMINVNGGNNPYSFQWKNSSNFVVSTSQNLTLATADTYTVTVTANTTTGCTYSRNFTITQPLEPLNSSSIVSNVDCFGNSTGDIDVTVWGGTPPYASSWDSGQSSEDIANVPAGNYQLTITDARGCSRVVDETITQPLQLSGVMSASDVQCFGESSGIVSVAASNGTIPYSYSWQNSTTLFAQNANSIVGVPADNYQVTITDANGCEFVGTTTVNQPTQLAGSTVATSVSCYGGSDGAIDLTINGGVLPYTFLWENSVSTTVGSTEDLNGIPAEFYHVTVTDFNNCVIEFDQEVTQPLSLVSVTAEVTDVLCYGDNTGAIDLTVTGGTAPYTFSWSNSQTTEDVGNLLAGSYSYDVLDANGCPFSGTEVVTQPAMPLTVTNVITDVLCFGDNTGSIDLTVTGGTAPYTYEWSNSTYLLSITSQDLINYPADDYRFEVTDANGCKVIDTLTITEPPLLETSVTGVNILCYGGNNGSVDLTVIGGSLPYTFLWNTGDVTEDLNNLYAGYYEVLVTDDHGCTSISSITLTEPADSLSFTYEVSHVLCNDGTDGSIELTVEGGTVNYDYAWSNGDTLSLIEDLTAGWYTFLVTDANGCSISDSIEVTQPDPLTLNEVITPASCFGFSDGIIDISPTGGTAPYSFTWFNSDYALSAQTEDLVGFPADIYQVEIIDTNDCFYEMFFEIEEPELLVIEYTFDVIGCYGGTDGNIYVDITGGNPAYTTTWSNGATTEDLLNVPFGVYQLNVVDTKGCTDSIEVSLSQPDSLVIAFEHTPVTCEDQYDGIAYATPTGGNGGYFYEWSNGSMQSMADSLQSTYYFLTVTDILGCTAYDSVFITRNDIGCIDPVNAFTPNGDFYNDTWVIDNMYLYPEAEVQIFNKWGNLIHYQKGLYEPWDGTIKDQMAPSEIYYWIINLNKEDRETLKGNITIVR